jgi:ethanolamine utilization protein EutN
VRIAKIIGTVTLNSAHPSLLGATLRLAVPLSLDNLQGRAAESAEELVLYDELGAGLGSFVALSEGAEAAQPFRPAIKPVDAYNAALLDQIDIRE